MNTRVQKFLHIGVVCCLFSLLFAAPAFASKMSGPSDDLQGRPNMAWNVSERKTAIVHVLNATPFPMVLKTSSDFADHSLPTDKPVQYQDSAIAPFVFSPTGIPHNIPAKQGTSFIVSWLDTAATAENADNIYPTTNLVYTMQNVVSSKDSSCFGNVDINLGFNRVTHQKELKSEYFALGLHCASAVIEGLTLVSEPNMIALLGFLNAGAEIAEDSVDINESKENSDQLYFNAFVVSATKATNYPNIYTFNSGTMTTSDAPEYDGFYTQHGDTQGCVQEYIVPTVILMREKSADHTKLNGHLPQVLVVLTDSVTWNSARNAVLSSTTGISASVSPAGAQISQYLKRTGKKGAGEFVRLARTLSPAEGRMFNEAFAAVRGHKALSREQEALWARFAAALEKHATELEPAKGQVNKAADNSTPTHKLPVRKNK